MNHEHSALALTIPQTEYHVLSLLGKKCEFQASNYHLKAEPHKNQKPGPSALAIPAASPGSEGETISH